MVVLPKREKCFSAAKTRTKLDIFEMHTSLGPGAQKLLRPKCLNEGDWIQLPFIFAVLVKIIASLVGMSLFHLWVTFQLKFSRIALLQKRLKMDSKTDFTSKMFRRLHICIDWNLHKLLNFYSFLTTSIFFDS